VQRLALHPQRQRQVLAAEGLGQQQRHLRVELLLLQRQEGHAVLLGEGPAQLRLLHHAHAQQHFAEHALLFALDREGIAQLLLRERATADQQFA